MGEILESADAFFGPYIERALQEEQRSYEMGKFRSAWTIIEAGEVNSNFATRLRGCGIWIRCTAFLDEQAPAVRISAWLVKGSTHKPTLLGSLRQKPRSNDYCKDTRQERQDSNCCDISLQPGSERRQNIQWKS